MTSIKKIGIWRRRYFSNRTTLILTSILIGLLTALCAALLKNGVHFMQHWVQSVSTHQKIPYLLFIFPTIGIFLTVLYTQIFRKGKLGRGVTNIIYAISRKSSFIEKDKLYSQMLTSILTVGFGGSAGLEAPIASTGSAVGSNIASWLRFTHKERTLLLACGAAAGISAIFNAPIAGVVFAFELLLVDMPMPVVVPLLIASASAALLSHFLYAGHPFVLITEKWHLDNLPFYIAFGIIAALVSVYAIRVYFYLGRVLGDRGKPYPRAIIGGLLLGMLIFLFPPLYGEGFNSVLNLLHQNPGELIATNHLIPDTGIWTLVIFTFVLMLLKVVATALTVGAGGNGGMFGSSLFTGAMCGYTFAHTVNILGLGTLSEVNFTVVGMAALMSGIIHAPLTAIFLIAEITGGYALFVPLMVVTSLSFLIARYFEPYSVYTKKLALKGDLIITNKDKFVLANMQLHDYLDTDFISLHIDETFTELVQAIARSKKNIFPVVDEKNILVGIIMFDTIHHLLFSPEPHKQTSLKELMVSPAAVVDIRENMETVLKKFDEAGPREYLPVTDGDRYVGFLSKSKIFTHYREHLIKDAVIPA